MCHREELGTKNRIISLGDLLRLVYFCYRRFLQSVTAVYKGEIYIAGNIVTRVRCCNRILYDHGLNTGRILSQSGSYPVGTVLKPTSDLCQYVYIDIKLMLVS